MDFDDVDSTDDVSGIEAGDEVSDGTGDIEIDVMDCMTENPEDSPDLSSVETEELSDFETWAQTMNDLAPDLDDKTLDALWEDPDNRSFLETELVDTALHPDYEAQRSILVDTETGKAVLDDAGNFIDCARNTKGAQRPDGMMVDDTGVHLREAKNYSDLNNLKQNIRHQTEDRRAAFGDDVDLTYVVAPNFTIEEAEKLQTYVEDRLGVQLEWQLK